MKWRRPEGCSSWTSFGRALRYSPRAHRTLTSGVALSQLLSAAAAVAYVATVECRDVF